MKQRTKLLLLLAVVLCLGGGNTAYGREIPVAEIPFPKAVPVIDDPLWEPLTKKYYISNNYVWANPNTLLYIRNEYGKRRILRRRIMPDGKVSPPEVLPVTLRKDEGIFGLSPNGKVLLLGVMGIECPLSFTFVRTDGKGKYRTIGANYGRLRDVGSVYGFDFYSDVPEEPRLSVYFRKPPQPLPETTYWDVIEWQGKNVVTTLYQKQFPSSYDRVSCSPDCKHILWQSREQKETFLEKKIVPSTVIRWLITDIDGSNERTIGIVPIEMQKESNLSLEWASDSKGIHFVMDKKLWYLAVP